MAGPWWSWIFSHIYLKFSGISFSRNIVLWSCKQCCSFGNFLPHVWLVHVQVFFHKFDFGASYLAGIANKDLIGSASWRVFDVALSEACILCWRIFIFWRLDVDLLRLGPFKFLFDSLAPLISFNYLLFRFTNVSKSFLSIWIHGLFPFHNQIGIATLFHQIWLRGRLMD